MVDMQSSLAAALGAALGWWHLAGAAVLLLLLLAVSARWHEEMRVDALFVYPVKSMRGVALESCALDRLGVAGDRRFAVVDGTNALVSALKQPRLYLIQPQITESMLVLEADSGERLEVPLAMPPGAPMGSVECASVSTPAADCGDDAAAFLQQVLGGEEPYRLVKLEGLRNPTSDPRFGSCFDAEDRTAFCMAPLLVTFTGSLRRLAAAARREGVTDALAMDRFRPNVVVRAHHAFSEDRVGSLEVGGAVLEARKPAERCAVTTLKQQDGGRTKGGAPLKQLRALHTGRDERAVGKPLFGLYMATAAGAKLRVGDTVRVARRTPCSWTSVSRYERNHA